MWLVMIFLTLSKWLKEERYSFSWSSESPLESRIRIWFSVSLWARWIAANSPPHEERNAWSQRKHKHYHVCTTHWYSDCYFTTYLHAVWCVRVVKYESGLDGLWKGKEKAREISRHWSHDKWEGINRVKPGLVKNVPGWQLQLHPSLVGGTSPRFGTASQQQAGPGEKMAQVTSITATRVDAGTPVECQLPTCLHASHALHAEVSKGGVLLLNEGPQVVGLPSKLQTELFILLLFL